MNPLVKARRIFSSFFVVFCFGVLARGEDSPKLPKAALLDFTSDDNFYRSTVAAGKITALLEPEILNIKEVEWVERSQLQKAADELNMGVNGFITGSDSLKLGKWVKADILVLGRFIRQENHARSLLLEAVDLNHADVLAERTLPIKSRGWGPVTVEDVDLQAVSSNLRDLIHESRDSLRQIKKQELIALLFFRNVDPSPRLNSFEKDLEEAFQTAASKTTDIRMLRFPKAVESQSEAEMAVLGLSDVDENAWQKMADAYLWGSFHELKSEGLPFEKVPVEVTLSLWSGGGESIQVVKQGTVEKLPELAKELSESLLDTARKTPVNHDQPTAREEVSRKLMERADALQKTLASLKNPLEKVPKTDEYKTLSLERLKTLQTACFFDPADWKIQGELLQMPSSDFKTPGFFQKMKHLNDVENFAKRFGQNQMIMKDPYAINLQPFQLVNQKFELLKAMINEFNYSKEDSFPFDAKKEVLNQWRREVESRYVKEVIDSETTLQNNFPGMLDSMCNDWVSFALHNMKNPDLSAKLIEASWPKYKSFCLKSLENKNSNYTDYDETGILLHRLYSDLGKPEKADEMLKIEESHIPSRPKINIYETGTNHLANARSFTTNSTPASKPILPFPQNSFPSPVEKKDPFASFFQLHPIYHQLLVAQNPYKNTPGNAPYYYTTQAMAWCDHALWTSVRVSKNDWRSSQGWEEQPLLFRYDPMTDSIEDISPKIGKLSNITSLIGHTPFLWMTLDQDGVWRLDPETLEVRKFEPKEGVLTPQMNASADNGGILYFGGVRDGKGLLNQLDLSSMAWSRLDLAQEVKIASPDSSKIKTTGTQGIKGIKKLCSFKQWLLVQHNSWQLLDTKTGKTSSLDGFLGSQVASESNAPPQGMFPWLVGIKPPAPTNYQIPVMARSCSSDDKGFWITTPKGLYFLDPSNEHKELLPTPFGAIKCMGLDGDFLWVAGTLSMDAGPTSPFPPGFPQMPGMNPARMPWMYQNMVFGQFNPNDKKAYTSQVLILHKPSRKWLGYFNVPGVVTHILASKLKIYLGLQFGEYPILELNKGEILSIPQEKWVAMENLNSEKSGK